MRRRSFWEWRRLGIDAVGHRVVQGGARFSEPTCVTPDVLESLRGLAPLDPLHNPTEVAWRYAIPRDLSDRLGLRRYGFHGISHRYVSERLLLHLGRGPEGTKLITCHLGSGASVCAIRDGLSVDTSMGMTPLEGLVMGTRSGDIDPGLLLFLLRTQPMTAAALDDLLNHQSGLRGLSGRSGDVRELEQAAGAHDARAEVALAIFAYHVRKYIGAYAAALGGIDALALTGGIGERSAAMRVRICEGLEFLGIRLDTGRNKAASEDAQISADNSRTSVWMILCDEERQIARETAALLCIPAEYRLPTEAKTGILNPGPTQETKSH